MSRPLCFLLGAMFVGSFVFAQPPPDNVPLPGNWDFSGSSTAGVAWHGTLTIAELDLTRFDPDPAKYNHMCQLELKSANSGKGKEMPCLFDPQTRMLSFSGGLFSNKYSYSAVLSSDGKRLMQGRWSEGDSETGTWSATPSEAPSLTADGEPGTPGSTKAQSSPGAAKVIGVRMHMVPDSYTGPCPSRLQLVAQITTDGPGTVWYQFLAGAVSKNGPAEGTLNFSAAGTKSVTLEATVTRTPSAPHASLLAAMEDEEGRHGPRNVSSGPVDYNVTCQQ